LFDLSQDERERADRKTAEPARFAALQSEWAAWDAAMLPYPAASYSYDPAEIDADRY
jgi:hypothetical protein